MNIIFFIVCFGASAIGAICGVGGGVIIKPVLDAFGVMGASEINFLSGCTVLSMSTYSIAKSRFSGKSKIQGQTGIPLAMGAAVGGIAGKWLFACVKEMSQTGNKISLIQAICLLSVTLATLLYTIRKDSIQTKKVQNVWLCVSIGLVLGIMSSFLGIGGGPINLVVLYYFFSMGVKDAAENSLNIIFFSQAFNLISSVMTNSVPDFQPKTLIFMIIGGITGGILGRKWNEKVNEKTVKNLFIILMVLIIFINIFNITKFI